MKLAILDGGSSLQKAQGVVRTYPSIWQGSVVDVGCRSRELETALMGHRVRYQGVDVDPSAEIVADLGEKLPFDDKTINVVAALDVLEHTDDIHHAFSELCRVAKDHIVITLPNCYEVNTRLRFLRGKPLSDKYGLPSAKPQDRHRWLFSLHESRKFIHDCAVEQSWRVADERIIVGPRSRHIAYAVRRWPNLLCKTYLTLLAPR